MNTRNLRRLTRWFLAQAQTLRPRPPWQTVSLVLVDDEGMTRLNREVFGKPHPTDVISFAYEDVPGEADQVTGEVVVNVDRAYQEGLRRNRPDLELALYIAHGCQHLTGVEDRLPAQRRRMRNRENRWLDEARRLGYAGRLFEPKVSP